MATINPKEIMKALLAIALLIAASSAAAQVHVRGYTKKDGTYVAPHERSAPNHTMLDNYSTKGNVNPYTGKPGTKDPEPYSTNQSSPATVQARQSPTRAQPLPQPANPYALPQSSETLF
jgi:hypothetical protein